MPRNMGAVGATIGDSKTAAVGDMDGTATLDQDRFIDVWNQQATRSEYYHVGYGVGDSQTNVGRLYADLVDSGAVNIEAGEFRFVVYQDSDRDYPKAIGPTFSVAELEESASADLRDQTMLPVLNPGAREDQHVALQLKCAAANDGNTIDTSSGSAKIPFSRIFQR